MVYLDRFNDLQIIWFGHSLREYINQFNHEVRETSNWQPEVVLMLAKDEVKEGSPFFASISKIPL